MVDVIYNGNGNTSGNGNYIDYNAAEDPSFSEIPVQVNPGNISKTGAVLKGWAFVNNTSSPAFTISGSSISPNSFHGYDNDYYSYYDSNMQAYTLYAVWENVPTSILYYHGNGNTGGTAPPSVTIPTGTSTTVSNQGTLVKTNNNFKHWNTDMVDRGTTYTVGASITLNSNTTLYAIWAPTFTVTYDGNGHTSGSAPVDNNSPYENNSTVTVLGKGTLDKSGHSFTGWNTASNGSGTGYQPNATFQISANVTLYAQWQQTQVTTYTMSYNANGGSNPPSDPNSPYNANSTVTVLGVGSMSRDGYTFLRWNTNSGGSGTNRNPGDTFQITANTTLYAVWQQNQGQTYTVTYNSSLHTSGSVPVDNTQYNNGATVTVRANTGNLARTGYAFRGWSTTNGGALVYTVTGSSVSPPTFTISGNTNLYAVWTQTYTLTYNGNGNTGGNVPVDNNSPYLSGTNATVLGNTGNLTKTNYTWLGWSTSSSAQSPDYGAGSTITMSTNRTLYAVWQLTSQTQTFTVTYTAGGASGTPPVDPNSPYPENSAVTALPPTGLTNTGNKFVNWKITSTNTGLITSNTITSSTLKFGSTTQYYRAGIAFIGNGYSINEVLFYLGPGDGSISCNARIYSDNNGIPDTQLASSSTFQSSSFVPGGDWVSFKFNTPFQTQIGTTYWIAVWASLSATSSVVTVYGSTDTGMAYTSSGGWVSNAFSPAFQILGSETTNLGSVAAGSTFSITSDVILEAQWTPLSQYTVTYDANGGSGSPPTDPNSPYYEDSTVTVLGQSSLYKPNYTFQGWSTSSSGGVEYAPNSTFVIQANTILYAVWQENAKYSVSYDGNGATGGSAPTDSNSPYYVGSTVTVLGQGTLVRTGYYWRGWAKTDNAVSAQYTQGSTFTIDANTVLYAVWEAIPTHTVTYHGNGNTGGSAPSDSNSPYYENSTVTVLGQGSLVKTNYTFLGWAVTNNALSPDLLPSATFTINDDVDLYAVWSENPKYSVSYNNNGGSGSQTDANSPYYVGSTVTVLNQGSMSKPDHEFKGWATSPSGIVVYFPGQTFQISTNTTLYAVWQIITYTVTYHANGGSGDEPEDPNIPYDAGSTVTVLDEGSLYRTNYLFIGWSTNSEDTEPTHEPGSTFTISEDMDFYAVWEPVAQFTVTYHGNGNTDGDEPEDSNSPYYDGATVTVLDEGTLEKANHVFIGWDTSSAGATPVYVPNQTFTINASVDLYAVWQENDKYAVFYNANGGSGSPPTDSNSPYYVNSTVTVLGQGSLMRDHHDFLGWALSMSATVPDYVAANTFTIEDNVTLFAVWREHPKYTVTYDGNGNTSGSPPTDFNSPYYAGATVTVFGRNSLLRANHTFQGWSLTPYGGVVYVQGNTFQMGTANVTLYAVWLANVSYSISYYGNGATDGTAPVDPYSPYFNGTTLYVLGQGSLLRSGYTFLGWSTDENAVFASYVAGSPITVTGTIILFAVWQKNPTYTVTYDAHIPVGVVYVGAAPIDNNEYEYNAVVTVKANPYGLQAEGYHLLGWSNLSGAQSPTFTISGSTVTPPEFNMPAFNLTLYAVWQPIPKYTVTYNANGGTGNTPVDPNSPYYENSTITLLGQGELTRYGYQFIGWRTNPYASITYQPGDPYTLTANINFYATWTALPRYTVIYHPNMATTGSVPEDNGEYLTGETVHVSPNTGGLQRTGYIFLGWSRVQNGTLDFAAYQNVIIPSTFQMGSANVVLYAKWEAEVMYTVTYEPNGATSGQVPENSHQYVAGSVVNVAPNRFNLARTSYDFLGWAYNQTATDPDFTVTEYDVYPSTFVITSNISLWAVWKAKTIYTVTYYPNWPEGIAGTGNVPVDNTIYYINDTVHVQSNPGGLTKEGYHLLGWMFNSTLYAFTEDPEHPVIPESVSVLSNVSFFAVWKPETPPIEIIDYYGNLESIKDLVRRSGEDLDLQATEELIGTKHDAQLLRFLRFATAHVNGKLVLAGAEPPTPPLTDAPDILHCITVKYAAGRFLNRDISENVTHYLCKEADAELLEYLMQEYGWLDVHKQPSCVVVGKWRV